MNEDVVKMYLNTNMTNSAIGKEFGITGSRVGQILRGELGKDTVAKLNVDRFHKRTNTYLLDESWKGLYESESMSILKIAEHLNVPASHVYRAVETEYTREYRDVHTHKTCDGFNRANENHPLHGTTWGDPKGLLSNYETSYSNGRKLLVHSEMFKSALGVNYSSSFIVHHINNIKSDNSKENLIMVSKSTHMKIHRYNIDVASYIRDESRLYEASILHKILGANCNILKINAHIISDTIDDLVSINDIGFTLS